MYQAEVSITFWITLLKGEYIVLNKGVVSMLEGEIRYVPQVHEEARGDGREIQELMRRRQTNVGILVITRMR